jgi:hypothetical protein
LLEDGPSPRFTRSILKVAVVSVFTALSLSTNYLMIDVPNIKLMDSLIFIAGFLFGLDVGVATSISVWLIYGFVNPYGQDSIILLFFLIAGECFYAIAGSLLRRTTRSSQMFANWGFWHSVTVFGGLGLLATFAYDALTNFATYLFLASSLYQALLIGMITGAPFAIIHEISNTIFFVTIVPGAIYAVQRSRLGLVEN